MAYYDRGHPRRLDYFCHGECFAGVCNAARGLKPAAWDDSFRKSLNSPPPIARRLKGRYKFKTARTDSLLKKIVVAMG
jgi:hypothetical protein